jgi:hypothetical protein
MGIEFQSISNVKPLFGKIKELVSLYEAPAHTLDTTLTWTCQHW